MSRFNFLDYKGGAVAQHLRHSRRDLRGIIAQPNHGIRAESVAWWKAIRTILSSPFAKLRVNSNIAPDKRLQGGAEISHNVSAAIQFPAPLAAILR